MLRPSKNTTAGVTSNEPIDYEKTKEGIPVKHTKQSSSRGWLGIVAALLVCIIAIGGASHYITSNYNEKLESRYKQYGSSKKPCAVIIPGLDGSISLFKVSNMARNS